MSCESPPSDLRQVLESQRALPGAKYTTSIVLEGAKKDLMGKRNSPSKILFASPELGDQAGAEPDHNSKGD